MPPYLTRSRLLVEHHRRHDSLVAAQHRAADRLVGDAKKPPKGEQRRRIRRLVGHAHNDVAGPLQPSAGALDGSGGRGPRDLRADYSESAASSAWGRFLRR
jgi:hypothetical protein